METVVHFNINNKILRLESVLYIGSSVIIAQHPNTGNYVMFYRSGQNDKEVKSALRKCGMRLGRKKSFKGIPYSELEVNHE